MPLKEKRILGLDIGTYSVKAVELDAGGREPVITNFGKTRVKSPHALVEAVTEGGRRHRAWFYLYQGPASRREAIASGDFRDAGLEPLRHAHALACR